jgi:hypothetical protein
MHVATPPACQEGRRYRLRPRAIGSAALRLTLVKAPYSA